MAVPKVTSSGDIRDGGSANHVHSALQPWIESRLRPIDGWLPEGHEDSAAVCWSMGDAWIIFHRAEDRYDGLDLHAGSSGQDRYDALAFLQQEVVEAVADFLPRAEVTWTEVVETGRKRR